MKPKLQRKPNAKDICHMPKGHYTDVTMGCSKGTACREKKATEQQLTANLQSCDIIFGAKVGNISKDRFKQLQV